MCLLSIRVGYVGLLVCMSLLRSLYIFTIATTLLISSTMMIVPDGGCFWLKLVAMVLNMLCNMLCNDLLYNRVVWWCVEYCMWCIEAWCYLVSWLMYSEMKYQDCCFCLVLYFMISKLPYVRYGVCVESITRNREW